MPLFIILLTLKERASVLIQIIHGYIHLRAYLYFHTMKLTYILASCFLSCLAAGDQDQYLLNPDQSCNCYCYILDKPRLPCEISLGRVGSWTECINSCGTAASRLKIPGDWCRKDGDIQTCGYRESGEPCSNVPCNCTDLCNRH